MIKKTNIILGILFSILALLNLIPNIYDLITDGFWIYSFLMVLLGMACIFLALGYFFIKRGLKITGAIMGLAFQFSLVIFNAVGYANLTQHVIDLFKLVFWVILLIQLFMLKKSSRVLGIVSSFLMVLDLLLYKSNVSAGYDYSYVILGATLIMCFIPVLVSVDAKNNIQQ